MAIKGPDVGYVDLLDHEITAKLKEASKERKWHPLRPSSAGHCSRKLALELMEYRGKAKYNKPLIEPHVDRLFSLGHSVEYSVLKSFELVKLIEQKYKQQALTLFELERIKPFENELLEGSCDAVFWSEKFKGIFDVKSKKDGWSAAFKSKWDELLVKLSSFDSITQISDHAFYAENLKDLIRDLNGDWMIDNLLQLNLYANTEFIKERGINFAGLIYYNKNDSRMFELRFNPSKELFHETKEKFNRIARLVDEDQLEGTVCEFSIGSLRYAFCDCHKMLPYADTDPIKTYFQSLPKKVWPKKVQELRKHKELKELYADYSEGKVGEEKAKRAEEALLKELTHQKVSKVQFDDGAIYEIKLLKSPKEHFELRRTKL